MITVMAASAAVVSLAAACGSSGSSSTTAAAGNAASASVAATPGGISPAAASIVKAAEAPGSWSGPASSPPLVKGKRIFILEAVGAAITQLYADGVKSALSAVGWTGTIYNGEGDPKQYSAGLQLALSGHYDGVVLIAVSPSLVANQVAAVRKAGIPIVDISDTEAPSTTGVSANIGYHPSAEGKIMAAAVAQLSGGNANVLVLTDNEFGVVTGRDAAFQATLPQLCSSCKVTQQLAITAAELNTPQLTSTITSELKANPSINYVFVGYDDAADSVVQAIQTGGLVGKVKVVSIEGTAQNLSYVKAGTIQVADLAFPDLWFGWEAVDALNRIYNHVALSPTVTSNEPHRLFIASNIADAKLTSAGGWSGDYAFEAKYDSVWGLK